MQEKGGPSGFGWGGSRKKGDHPDSDGEDRRSAASGNRTQLSSVTGWHTNRYTNTATHFRAELVLVFRAPLRNKYESVLSLAWRRPRRWLHPMRPARTCSGHAAVKCAPCWDFCCAHMLMTQHSAACLPAHDRATRARCMQVMLAAAGQLSMDSGEIE